jgi:hypothetical protein
MKEWDIIFLTVPSYCWKYNASHYSKSPGYQVRLENPNESVKYSMWARGT